MYKIILLGLSCLLGVNRSVISHNVIQNNGSYYFSDLSNSNTWGFMVSDGDNLYYNFSLNTPVSSNGANQSDDILVSNNNDTYNGGTIILYSWSNYEYFVTYDDSTTYAPQVSFDSNSRYILATCENTDNQNLFTESLFNNDDYFLSFSLRSNEQYLYVLYNISYASNNDVYNYSTYSGVILVNQALSPIVNIPYQYANSLTPSFTDERVNCNITIISPSMTGYSQGYSDGYNNGNTAGYESGYTDGVGNGYQSGYNVGFVDGSNSSSNFVNLFFSVADTPVFFLRSLFSVEIFGIRIYTVVLSLITTMVMIWVIRKFVL